jgi:hypothetical protein
VPIFIIIFILDKIDNPNFVFKNLKNLKEYGDEIDKDILSPAPLAWLGYPRPTKKSYIICYATFDNNILKAST